MLVARPEFVLVSRFEIPTEAMLAGAPEHEVEHRLGADGVAGRAGFPGVNPLGTGASHKLDFLREAPGLFEKQIGAPFGRVAAEERCDSGFEFEPMCDRSDLYRHGRAEAGYGVFEIPGARGAKFEDGGGFLFVGLLRKHRRRSKQQRGDGQRFYQAHGQP